MVIFTALLSTTLIHAGTLDQLTDAPHRTPQEKARDEYRHPVETLKFFDVEKDMTVVEIWPGGGWYTSILAPWLYKSGTYYAAHFPEDSDIPFYRRSVTSSRPSWQSTRKFTTMFGSRHSIPPLTRLSPRRAPQTAC
jgi:predicted methyltransferase